MVFVAVVLSLLWSTDAWSQQDWPQARSIVISRFGIVAAEYPLAAQAGALVLTGSGTAA